MLFGINSSKSNAISFTVVCIPYHLLHGFQQRCGRECLAKEIDRHSIYIGMDELDSQSVHVGHREHGYNGLTGLVGEMAVAERIGV